MERDYPNVAAAGRYFRESEWDKTFEFGLDLMLRNVETIVEERQLSPSLRQQDEVHVEELHKPDVLQDRVTD